MNKSLAELAALCNGKVIGDPEYAITGVNTISAATSEQLVFVADRKYEKLILSSEAGAVLTSNPELKGIDNLVIVENPQLAFVIITESFYPSATKPGQLSNSASIGTGSLVPDNCFIGRNVCVGDNVRLGEHVQLEDGCHVESNCQIGDRTTIHQNVVIKEGTRIGKDCIIHPGAVLGADGFGLTRDGEQWRRIPQVGRLAIGDEVDVGANTTIDRGALGDTVVGNGVKLDNLIQVGHNVRIGANTVIAAHTAIAGSSIIGENCEIGGCVGIMDHSEIADGVKIGGGSVVSGRITEPGIYSSSIKAEKLGDWQKNVAWLRKLGSLADRIKKLENK